MYNLQRIKWLYLLLSVVVLGEQLYDGISMIGFCHHLIIGP